MTQAIGTVIFASPVGKLHLAATEAGLTHLVFAGESRSRLAGDDSADAKRILAETARQLEEYFAGKQRDFDLPLVPAGTDFQRAVWRGLESIPYGETLGYGELARRIGRPRAVRAVGAANGANPIPIILPCHRVIGADGQLTGYGGGLPIKTALLCLEGVPLDATGERILRGRVAGSAVTRELELDKSLD